MKALAIITSTLLCAGAALAQSTSTLDNLAAQAQQRANDYASGADLQRDRTTYINNYGNSDFWRNIWSASNANSTNWYSQFRLLKIHLQAYIEHLEASTNWIKTCGEITGADGQKLTVRKSSYWYSSSCYGILDGSQSDSWDLGTLFNTLCGRWKGDSTTDPTKAYMVQDLNILQLATSDYNGNLFNYSTTDSDVGGVINLLSTNPVTSTTQVSDASLVDPTYAQALQNMQNAGAILPTTNIKQSQALSSLVALYNNAATSPANLENQALGALFADLAIGSWSGDTYVFRRPVVHTATYRTRYATYCASVSKAISYLQAMLNNMNTQLAEANARDQQTILQASSYRQDAVNQQSVASVITVGNAKEIFQREVGSMSLSSIPLINPAAYVLWLVGPPWSETPCFPSAWGCTPNPLYYTLTAQLVRGLDKDGGITFTGTQMAQNALKNAMQQLVAIADIQDHENKKATDEQTKQLLNNAYGTADRIVTTPRAQNSISDATLLTNNVDSITLATSQAILESRANSQALANQQATYYNQLSSTNTIIQRDALQNQQQVTRAQAIEDMNRAFNTRAAYRAAVRNEALQKEAERKAQQDTVKNIQY